MKNGFLKMCSIFLVLILIFNMLPHQALAEVFSTDDLGITSGNAVTNIPQETAKAEVVEEVTDKRTECTKEFRMNNGLHLAAVYNEPVHFKENGQWKEIDNTLVASTSKGKAVYTNTAGALQVTFPQQLTANQYVTVTKDGYTLQFGMGGVLSDSGFAVMSTGNTFSVQQANTASAQVQRIDTSAMLAQAEHPQTVVSKLGSRLQYSNVYSNTNVVYDLQSNTLKESVILSRYDSSLRGYRYTLNVGDMVPVLQEDNSIWFYGSGREEVVMVMPAPFLVDAAKKYNYDVEVTLQGSGSTYTLQYLLPTQWLAAEDRAWPVVLDPDITADIRTSNVRDVTVAENTTFQYTASTIQCGYSSSWGKYRILIKYKEIPPISSSDVIVSAKMRLYKPETSSTEIAVEVHKVNTTWESESATWANAQQFNETIEDFAMARVAGDYYWDVTDIVRDWYANENTGMLFKVPTARENAQNPGMIQFYSSDFSNYSTYMPTLTVYFRNNTGLESYWDYTSSTAGRAGTGYVNNYTGNLVWVHGDIGFGGNRMPVSISHVYNVSDRNNDNNNNYTFGMGYGWRTNFNQLVYQWDKDSTYYIWEDADGTKHYFKRQSAGIYKDEDGLELTLTTTGSGNQKFCITDKNGNKSFFNTGGYLTEQRNNQATTSSITITYSGNLISTITDGAGRVYTFTYTGGLLSRIGYRGSGSTDISYVTFTYTSGDLTRITDKDGKYAAYTYSNHLLTTATDVDGYYLEYTYNTPVSTWQPYRIQTIEEFYTAQDGSTVAGGELQFAYAHNQTTITDHDGNKQILQFNHWGNTISIQDGEGHAQFAKYAKESDPVNGKGNQLRVSSKLQNTVANLLSNNSFEQSSTWTGEDATVTNSTDDAHYGNKSMKLVTTDNGYAQTVFVAEAEKTYTFSAYVKTGSSKAYLRIGSNIVTANLKENSGWTRLQLSYTNLAPTSRLITIQVVNVSGGTTYVDSVQVEQAHTASRYNLVSNGDFRTTDSWSNAGTITPASDSGAPQLSTDAYKFSGVYNGTYRGTQTIQIGDGKKDDCFVIAGWGKSNSVPNTIFANSMYQPGSRAFCIQVEFRYTDGTNSLSDTNTAKNFMLNFNPTVDNWQYAAMPVVADKDYSSIKIHLAYINGAGEVWFDGIQLYKERFGVLYTYIEDSGDLDEVTDVNGGVTKCSYDDDTGDLKTIEEPDGTRTNYVYDDHHNLTRMTTDTGVVYQYTYDQYGNNLSVMVSDGYSTMTTSATYTADGNRMVSSTDAAGNVTTYGYNANTNVLEWVKYPNDADSTNTTYTYDSMYRVARSAANLGTKTLSANYSYEEDMLKSITTGSTTYSFTYGDFGLREQVKVGNRILASYTYSSRNNYLQTLAYGNGDSVEYTYDSKGNLLQETYKHTDTEGNEQSETIAYTYDNNGALATVTDSNADANGVSRTTTYYYDDTNRLVKYTETGGGYNHMVEYVYNAVTNNLLELWEEINGVLRKTFYVYDTQNRISSVNTGFAKETYSYDGFDRVTHRVTEYDNQTIAAEVTEYRTVNGKMTGQVAALTTEAGIYRYTYDANGNIIKVTVEDSAQNITTTNYAYDAQNQLIREENQAGGFVLVWTYDDAGNIQSRKKYSYATGTAGYPIENVSYGYTDPNWGDLLTTYGGHTITYDAIGNPLNYYNGTNWEFAWKNGRELTKIAGNGFTWSLYYDANGMRTKRETSSTTTANTYRYVYNGGTLSQMKKGGEVLDFFYGADGTPMAVVYNDSLCYFYVTNLQGDVVALLDQTGAVVVNYTYDAWGKLLSTSGSLASTIGALNPLRYRGYIYDNETGFYYLQSRYYDPTTGRFINVDNQIAGVGGEVLGYNMFAYCGNNPVRNADKTGHAWYDTLWDWFNTAAGISNPISTLNAIGALAVAAIQGRWNDIKSDWDNGCLNPFNQSEDVALRAKVLSFYKGSTVVRQDNMGTFSMFGTIWAESDISATDLKHEYGHSVQERLLGSKYMISVGIPSALYYWYACATKGSAIDYYSNPWERTADWLGGVNGRPQGYKTGSLAWGISENLLGPIVIPIYIIWGY